MAMLMIRLWVWLIFAWRLSTHVPSPPGIGSGYVIPLMAQRSTTVPPMIYPMEWGDGEHLGAVLQASREVMARGDDGVSPLVGVLEKHGVTHVFIGALRLSAEPSELAKDARIRETYRQD